MLRSLVLPAALLSILPATLALEWLGPRATPIPSLPDAQGFTPKPTNGPQLNVVAKSNPDLKLLRRQSRSIDPQTCGFVNGNGAYGITCDGVYACGYNTKLSAFGCTYSLLRFLTFSFFKCWQWWSWESTVREDMLTDNGWSTQVAPAHQPHSTEISISPTLAQSIP
jgi:hypothetical protein